MKYKIIVTKLRKQYYWKIMHKNGKVLATSETYSSFYKAKQTATSIFKSFKRGICSLNLPS